MKLYLLVLKNTTQHSLGGCPQFLLWVILLVDCMFLELRPFPEVNSAWRVILKMVWRADVWPGQGSGWGLSLVPQAPRSTGHTASASGPSPDTDLWDRGITIKPAVRTTQMVAQDNSRTNTHMHPTQLLTHSHVHLLCTFFFYTGTHRNQNSYTYNSSKQKYCYLKVINIKIIVFWK